MNGRNPGRPKELPIPASLVSAACWTPSAPVPLVVRYVLLLQQQPIVFLNKVLHHLQHVQLHTYLVCTEKLINICWWLGCCGQSRSEVSTRCSVCEGPWLGTCHLSWHELPTFSSTSNTMIFLQENNNSLRCSTQSSQGQHFIISFVLCNCFFLRSCDPKLWQFKKSSQFLQPMAHMQFLNAFVVVCL